MADDLAHVRQEASGDSAQEIEAPPTMPTQLKPQAQQKPLEDLDELLPLEDGNSTIAQQIPSQETHGPTRAHDELKEEIFPKAAVDKKTLPGSDIDVPPSNLPTGGVDDQKSAPQPRTEDGEEGEVPEESPEELLGIEGDENAGPQLPPPPQKPSTNLDYIPQGGGKRLNFLNRRTLLVGGSVVIGAVIVAVAIFFVTGGGGELELIPAGEETEGPGEAFITPTPIVIPDFEQEVLVANLLSSTLQAALDDIKTQNYPEGKIIYLPVRLEQLTSAGEPQFLSAQIFLSSLGINAPDNLFEAINPVFMPYVYGPGDEEQARCEEAAIEDPTCYGPRFGLVLQAKEGMEDELPALASQWRALDDSNLETLVLSDTKEVPSAPSFNSAQFSGLDGQKQPATVYYINMPLSTTALNFAVVDNLIVIATSKNSSFVMLDRILGEQ